MIDFIAAFLNFAAFILSLFALLGDISNIGFFRDIYYSRIDLVTSSNSIINALTGAVGVPNYITVGAFSLCEGMTGKGITYCTPPKLGFDYRKLHVPFLLFGKFHGSFQNVLIDLS